MYPNESRTDVLAAGSALNFNPNHLIHSAALVDRTHLYWTDVFEMPTGLVGEEPRHLNIVKSNLYNKAYRYELHFALDDQFVYSTLVGTTLTVTLGTTVVNVTFTTLTLRSQAIAQIKAAILAASQVATEIEKTLVIGASAVNQTTTIITLLCS